MDIYKILPVNLHIHSEHSKTWKKIKSVSRLFQRNISSREKTRKLVNLFCYKTTVTIKIILTNAKLLLSFINIHLLQSVLLFVNPILIHSLFSKIYSHQGDLIFWYYFSIYVQEFVRSKHFSQTLSFNLKKHFQMKHCFEKTLKDTYTLKLLKWKTLLHLRHNKCIYEMFFSHTMFFTSI